MCTHAFLSGTTVALTPHPASGYRFSSWSGACTGTSTCSVTMSANKSVTATFTAIPPPNTTLTGFTLHNSTRSATISFTGSGGVGALHFLCKLDAGSFLSCSSPKTYTSLGKGSHTIAVEAVDSRGKADPSPATRSFTVT